MKYIVESVSIFRMIHVVEAENHDEAYRIAKVADDNFQEHMGEMKVEVCECTEERLNHFKNKEYFWDGVSFKDEDGFVGYHYPGGETFKHKDVLVK